MTDLTTPTSGRLFVRYTHVSLGRLPLEIHVNGEMIPVDAVDAEAHAKAAPADAEWFQYFSQAKPGDPYSPLDDVPMYFLDTTPEEYLPKYGIQGVVMRHCGMRMPFYPTQTHRNAVISTR